MSVYVYLCVCMCVCVCVCVCLHACVCVCAFQSSQDGSITLPQALMLPPTLDQLYDKYEVVGGPEVMFKVGRG